MTLKQKDISKMTIEDATKKLGELEKGLLELEPTSQKKRPLKKGIARLKTYIHIHNKGKTIPKSTKTKKKMR